MDVNVLKFGHFNPNNHEVKLDQRAQKAVEQTRKMSNAGIRYRQLMQSVPTMPKSYFTLSCLGIHKVGMVSLHQMA